MHQSPLFLGSQEHPLTITPEGSAGIDDLLAHVAGNRSEIAALLRRHGGLLFRGFRLDGPDHFRRCAEGFGAVPFAYVGGNTPRTQVAADVFTSTEFPATEVIALHNEMSYLPQWPRRLFFYSALPAASGGQTTLASSRDVLRAVPAPIVRRLQDKGVLYVRHFQTSRRRLGKTWQATYQTEDRQEVEHIVASQGSICDWLADGVLRVATRCDAVRYHPDTAEELWFNQAEQWHPSALSRDTRVMFEQLVGVGRMPHDCAYGDGEPIDETSLTEIRRALDRSKLLFDWQRHDLLVLDNMLMMHGREPFTGERKTLAYLSAN